MAMSIRSIVMAVIGVVIAVTLVPTIWDAVWTDAAASGVNSTTWTLLKLVPLIFVASVIIGAVLLGIGGD